MHNIGTLGTIEVYDASLPVPKYSSTSSIAIATKVDIEGVPIDVKVLDLDDYAVLYGIEENKSLLQGQLSSLIATILKRTPTAKLARAVITAVLMQLPLRFKSLGDEGRLSTRTYETNRPPAPPGGVLV